jgi:hypothetical protein
LWLRVVGVVEVERQVLVGRVDLELEQDWRFQPEQITRLR